MIDRRNITRSTFPDQDQMTRFANQIAYDIRVDANTEMPKISNYISGPNGWYRVGYKNGTVFQSGTLPSGLSKSVMTGGYGFWSEYNADLLSMLNQMERMYTSTDRTVITYRKKYYGMDENRGSSLDFLQFYPSLIGSSDVR